MTNLSPKSEKKSASNVNPLQCLASAIIAGGLATLAYMLMKSIKLWFKASPFKGIINKNFHD
ncbi:MAG: DUF3082 domain-containing protein [Okeania sp. SIO3B3]|nr:DUF3082 domain-containing protein [Okeania sp. SIO3B3]